MDVLSGANVSNFNLFRTTNDLMRQMHALSTGLRITSALDDPSGLAIAETLKSQVAGFQAGLDNVQTAGNLLTVADGTLATVARILQRIHQLVIEAHTDLNSDRQLLSIQTEINALRSELNKIASNSTFNGISLLDGSLDASQAKLPTTQIVSAEANPDGTVPRPDVYDASGSGSPNAGPLIYNARTSSVGAVPAFIEFQVISYSTNPVDPITGPLGVPGVIIRTSVYSQDPSFGAAPQIVADSAIPTGTGPDAGSGGSLQIISPSGTQTVLYFDLANLSPQDVGVAVSVVTDTGKPAGKGHPLQVHSGANEGAAVSVSLPSVSTEALSISDVSILRPNTVDVFNTPTGQSSSNTIAADDAQVRLETAMQQIGAVRAEVGAQLAALREDANSAAIQTVNLKSSESSIRDANMAQTLVAYTRDRLKFNIGVTMLRQMQANAKQIVALLMRGI